MTDEKGWPSKPNMGLDGMLVEVRKLRLRGVRISKAKSEDVVPPRAEKGLLCVALCIILNKVYQKSLIVKLRWSAHEKIRITSFFYDRRGGLCKPDHAILYGERCPRGYA